METYPSGLQQKMNADNFQIDFGDTTVRSGMDVGPDKVRRRFTDGVDVYNVGILMDIDDFNTLDTFYKTTLAGGSLSFGFTNPMNGNSEEWRFIGAPSVRPIGGRMFEVGMKWERQP